MGYNGDKVIENENDYNSQRHPLQCLQDAD